jgi:hypothetical protein
MRKPTKKEFLKFTSGFYGEEINHLQQIELINFDGRELYTFCKMWVEHLKENKNV